MSYNQWRSLLVERRFDLPKGRPLRRILYAFTLAEKVVFAFFATLFIFSGLILVSRASSAYLVEVPTRGGTLTEGVIGNPRFINPVLALSEADKNLTSLVYSGLVRVNPDGSIENELAEEVVISENRLVYTVTLDSEARFHDGARVTADDVVFTIQKILDPNIKSPRRGNWEGVVVEKIDELTVSFTLKKAYTPFIYNLTLGIIPRHIWKNVSDDEFAFSQFNTLPIGSGPYRVERAERNSGGIPDYYKLNPFDNYKRQKPFIDNLVFKFYPNEESLIEAYRGGQISSFGGISPDKIREFNLNQDSITTSPLPRVFGVFFNQGQSKVLLNKEVRQALELSSPREDIIEKVLNGYGTAIEHPLPAGLYSWTSETDPRTLEERLEAGREILLASGWRPNEETGVLEKNPSSGKITLSFSISTGDAPELVAVANELKNTWEKLGASIEVKVFETGDLNQNVIRPREFEALLFGLVVGRDADLYPFWHSSQRNDPGLNIALYANTRADKFLDEARTSTNPQILEEKLRAFALEVEADIPAVFLYTPSYLYVVPEKIKALEIGPLTVAQDRFLGIRNWYIEEDKVWSIFTN